MISWILVILTTTGSLTVIEGFKTEDNCYEAAKTFLYMNPNFNVACRQIKK